MSVYVFECPKCENNFEENLRDIESIKKIKDDTEITKCFCCSMPLTRLDIKSVNNYIKKEGKRNANLHV